MQSVIVWLYSVTICSPLEGELHEARDRGCLSLGHMPSTQRGHIYRGGVRQAAPTHPSKDDSPLEWAGPWRLWLH